MKNEEMAENSYLRYFGGLALHYTINLGLRPFDSISTIGTVGIMICYDMGFPETARFLTLQGAEIIFCPSAWRSEDRDIWNLNIPQRALENTVFLAAVNRFGQEGDDLYLFGGSKVCNPRGQVLAEIKEEKEAILYCEIDLNEIIAQRLFCSRLLGCKTKYIKFSSFYIS
jgi:predicted amidohydrolase